MLKQDKIKNIIKRGWTSNVKGNIPFINGSVFKYEKGSLLVEVHHYIGCGDAWFLTCNTLGIRCRTLMEKDVADAIDKASEIIRNEVIQLYKDGKDI